MKLRVRKAKLILDQTDQHERAPWANIGECRFHRGRIAGRIIDSVEARRFDRARSLPRRRMSSKPNRSRAMSRRSWLVSRRVTVLAADAGKQRRAKADGSGTDDERATARVACARRTACAPMARNSTVAEASGDRPIAGETLPAGRNDLLAEGTVRVDAQHLDGHAAIGLADLAGMAGAQEM